MGHPARPKRRSKPRVSKTVRSSTTVGAIPATVKQSVPEAASRRSQVPAPQLDLSTSARPAQEALAGPSLTLTDHELDELFCMAVRHHFEQEKVWVPSVLRTMPLLEGINDRTGRPCRIYVRPNRRVLIVETLS